MVGALRHTTVTIYTNPNCLKIGMTYHIIIFGIALKDWFNNELYLKELGL